MNMNIVTMNIHEDVARLAAALANSSHEYARLPVEPDYVSS